MKAKILKLGTSCNNRCYFCSEDGTDYEMDFEKLSAVIKTARTGCEQIILTGKEPTIYPRIIELLHTAKESGYKVITIVTNGRMFAYQMFTREAVLAGLTDVLVALHAHTPEIHDRITSVAQSFRQTLQGINCLQKVSATMSPFNLVSISAGTVIVEENYAYLPQIVDLVASVGIQNIFFIRCKPDGAGPDFAKIRPHLSRALDLSRQHGINAFTKGFSDDELGDYRSFRYEQFLQTHPVLTPEL
ncbi:MAG: radical SAM protein [bacterium]